MSDIVLNELEWTQNAISNKSLGKKPAETLRRVAQYYFIVHGMNKKAVKEHVSEFLLDCDRFNSVVKWEDTIDKVVAYASKHNFIDITKVIVTKNELASILSIKSKQEQRQAFTLLCVAKYWNEVNQSNNSWVNTKDSDIMRMANINTSIKRQSYMQHNLSDMGLIQFSKKIDNINIQVCFIDNDEEEMIINDFRNLGYQFMEHIGTGDFFRCKSCGIIEKRKPKDMTDTNRGRKKIYCKKCSLQ